MSALFEQYREKFSRLYAFVHGMHRRSKRPHRGHGLDHDVAVAMLGVLISPDERTAVKAFCSGLIHSVDRLFDPGEVDVMVRSALAFLPKGHFTTEEIEEMFQAVIRHEKPRDDDSLVQQVLMDADRLANIMLSGALRAAQWLHNKPVIEFEHLDGTRNPSTTWTAPCSALDGVKVTYQMLHPMRTAKGKELADQYVNQLKAFVLGLEGQYKELGLVGISLASL